MKRNLLLSLCALALAGCESAHHTPYLGGVGEYGYTYDLNASPSIFRDTSYRPLTVRDVMGPLTVTATNEVALSLINQELKERADTPGLSNMVEEVSNPANTNAIPRPPGTNAPEKVVPLPAPTPPATTNSVPPAKPEEKNPSEEKPTTPP